MKKEEEFRHKLLVSIIIPVFNVEDYLRDCLDSILCQTWHNIDVILIDDGSLDSCGIICDSYAAMDPRFRVFHTSNQGISAARNLGIAKSRETQSDYLVFVDSDDWLDKNMVEILVNVALDTNADVVACGEYYEYPNKTIASHYQEMYLTGIDAVKATLSDKMGNHIMNKIWKRDCFDTVLFPVGRVYEDIAINYKILAKCKTVKVISDILYHYRIREGSVAQSLNLINVMDYWKACKERYDFCQSHIHSNDQCLVMNKCEERCISATGKIWRTYYKASSAENIQYKKEIKTIAAFVQKKIPLFGRKEWPIHFKICAFLTRYANGFAYFSVWWLYKIWQRLSEK